MSYDLCNSNGDHVAFNLTGWEQVLKLAEMYGWRTAGTLPPEDLDTEWDGDYFLNDGEVVTADDAKAIAEALTKAMDDIPGHDAMKHKTGKSPKGVDYVKDGAAFSPFEFFSGKGKKHLREFISFCRRGSFQIW